MSNLDATAREIEAWFFNDYVATWVKPCPYCQGTKWEPALTRPGDADIALGRALSNCCDGPVGGADELGCGGWLARDHAYVLRQQKYS